MITTSILHLKNQSCLIERDGTIVPGVVGILIQSKEGHYEFVSRTRYPVFEDGEVGDEIKGGNLVEELHRGSNVYNKCRNKAIEDGFCEGDDFDPFCESIGLKIVD